MCWCCRRELVLLQEGAGVMPTNRFGKQVSNLAPFSFFRSHFLSSSCRIEKKIKFNRSCSVTALAAPQCVTIAVPWHQQRCNNCGLLRLLERWHCDVVVGAKIMIYF